MLIPHQRAHTHTHCLPRSHKTATSSGMLRDTHKRTLSKRCWLVVAQFIMLLYTFSICTMACKWLCAAKIMNSLERTHLLSFSSALSLDFYRLPFTLVFFFFGISYSGSSRCQSSCLLFFSFCERTGWSMHKKLSLYAFIVLFFLVFLRTHICVCA